MLKYSKITVCIRYIYSRGAIWSKTAVLPLFCKIECGCVIEVLASSAVRNAIVVPLYMCGVCM